MPGSPIPALFFRVARISCYYRVGFVRFLVSTTYKNNSALSQAPGDGVGGAIYTPVDEISRLPITVGRPDYEQYFSQIEGYARSLTMGDEINSVARHLGWLYCASLLAACRTRDPSATNISDCASLAQKRICIRSARVHSRLLHFFVSMVLPDPNLPHPLHSGQVAAQGRSCRRVFVRSGANDRIRAQRGRALWIRVPRRVLRVLIGVGVNPHPSLILGDLFVLAFSRFRPVIRTFCVLHFIFFFIGRFFKNIFISTIHSPLFSSRLFI